jgi:hypothetical protein
MNRSMAYRTWGPRVREGGGDDSRDQTERVPKGRLRQRYGGMADWLATLRYSQDRIEGFNKGNGAKVRIWVV